MILHNPTHSIFPCVTCSSFILAVLALSHVEATLCPYAFVSLLLKSFVTSKYERPPPLQSPVSQPVDEGVAEYGYRSGGGIAPVWCGHEL